MKSRRHRAIDKYSDKKKKEDLYAGEKIKNKKTMNKILNKEIKEMDIEFYRAINKVRHKLSFEDICEEYYY